MTDRGIIILGAGGHGRVVADALLAGGRRVIGFCDADPARHGKAALGLAVLGGDDVLSRYSSSEIELANGIGSVRDTRQRSALFERMRVRGFRFASVRHPSAVVSEHAELAEGVQLMAGCVVQVGACLEANVLINTAASVDHDCIIGAGSHIAPGATLSGSVQIGAGTHVGTGARVLQGVRIGRGCVVGAGAVVLQDLPDGGIAMGVPASAGQGQ